MIFLHRFLAATWALLAEMAPYLLFGFLLAGVLSVFMKEERVVRLLGGRGLWPSVKGALVGVPMPLCSCGVIPVTASLWRHGAGRGAAVSFLASTPQTGVDSIAATWGMLGPLFAGIRVGVAFLSGALAGALADAFGGRAGESGAERAEAAPAPAGLGGNKLLAALRYGFLTLPRDIGKSLLFGMLAAGLIGALLPPGALGEWVGRGPLAYLAVTAVAVPLYVCSTGSIPLAAALVASGLSPGAALVFLVAGPATNAATVATSARLFGWRTTTIYLGSLVACAWGAGFALDAFSTGTALGEGMHDHGERLGGLHHASGIALLALLAAALWPRPAGAACCGGDCGARPEGAAESGGGRLSLGVEGMRCSRCVAAVEKALLALPGVERVSVDLDAGSVGVEGSGLDAVAVEREIRALGYTVRGAGRN